jgi:hypothetical protein
MTKVMPLFAWVGCHATAQNRPLPRDVHWARRPRAVARWRERQTGERQPVPLAAGGGGMHN